MWYLDLLHLLGRGRIDYLTKYYLCTWLECQQQALTRLNLSTPYHTLALPT